MNWFPNPNRIRELFTEESVQRAAAAALAWKNRHVLAVIVWGWVLLLGMVFTLIVTVRAALLLPLFR